MAVVEVAQELLGNLVKIPALQRQVADVMSQARRDLRSIQGPRCQKQRLAAQQQLLWEEDQGTGMLGQQERCPGAHLPAAISLGCRAQRGAATTSEARCSLLVWLESQDP